MSETELGAAVRSGLTAVPKCLPPRFLYDALGSALFDAITELPWYPIPRAESGLLERNAREILDAFPDPLTLIELGPGSGKKLDLVLEQGARGRAVSVRLVDLSPAALAAATKRLERHASVRVETHAASFEAGLEAAARASKPPRLVLFLGSNIGNLDDAEAVAFLALARGALAPGDGFLLGADLVKPREDLLRAYDDPLGVTAAFNRNLLVRVNRELGSAFDLEDFAHAAVWNEAESRVEMHLVARRAVSVCVPAVGITVTMAEGETIHTESSHKYRVADLESLGARAGFTPKKAYVDRDLGFAHVLFSVPPSV